MNARTDLGCRCARHGGLGILLLLSACASMPPGAERPKSTSAALDHPEATTLGAHFLNDARSHEQQSGFHLLNVGLDGLLARVQLIDAAERSVDAQYFIFRGDETGRLVIDALRRARERGVRVRVLVDDGDTVEGDEQVASLSDPPRAEVRVFNPFRYRGHSLVRRAVEFIFNHRRLDYRMHNKLLVVDDSVALIGGRNIGNEYFQIDPDAQFADDDIFATGGVVAQISHTFDLFWNSALAIPVEFLDSPSLLAGQAPAQGLIARHRMRRALAAVAGVDYAARIAAGEPVHGLISGGLPLVWAPAKLLYDSPDKKRVVAGEIDGHLMSDPVLEAAAASRKELLMITPYVVPDAEEMGVLKRLRTEGTEVGIVTNSLASSRDILAFAGYTRYRMPLLKEGVRLYEVRALLGSARGSGQASWISRYGHYGLHAKAYVFDRRALFIGSMNFDKRSRNLNTEIGLLLESGELAAQEATRFEAMARPESAYVLDATRDPHGTQRLHWVTSVDGKTLQTSHDPDVGFWKRLATRILSWLPVSREL